MCRIDHQRYLGSSAQKRQRIGALQDASRCRWSQKSAPSSWTAAALLRFLTERSLDRHSGPESALISRTPKLYEPTDVCCYTGLNDVAPLRQSPHPASVCLGLRREAQRHAAFARTSRIEISKLILRPKAVSPLPLCHRTPIRPLKHFSSPPQQLPSPRPFLQTVSVPVMLGA